MGVSDDKTVEAVRVVEVVEDASDGVSVVAEIINMTSLNKVQTAICLMT